jgi:hypothetical protein
MDSVVKNAMTSPFDNQAEQQQDPTVQLMSESNQIALEQLRATRSTADAINKLVQHAA